MSYKFSKEDLEKLLVDYNKLALEEKDLPDKVHIWDETLRDGEQSPTVYLTLDEKIHLAKMMDEIGVEVIAVGYPAVSEQEKHIVKTIVNEDCKNSSIVGIARPKEEDIDACIDADLKEIVVFMPISGIFMETLKLTKEDELEQIRTAIHYAKDNGFKVNWVSEDGTRAEFDHIKNVFTTAINAGAERVILGDTVGVLTPKSSEYLVGRIRDEVIAPLEKDIPMGIHTHNDFGLAVANTVTGVFEGCTYPHTCINGYGERAGNAALEEVVTILERIGIDTNINLTKLPELSRVCEKYFCLPLSQYKPIVGEYAFSHESGLHIAAILAHPLTYEPINPKMVGRRRKFYLGKFSGSKSILHALKNKLKVLDLDVIPDEVIKKIVNEVKKQYELSSKEQIQESFEKIKKELNNISTGLSDKEFFHIVNKYAQPFVPAEFKPKNKIKNK
ncbi:MAG: homoaconitate hydratase [Promethearchaeota archaeon]|nr:MAG: homoaconitate hydratase [Candidatus Lokiarchaeota archaeon]